MRKSVPATIALLAVLLAVQYFDSDGGSTASFAPARDAAPAVAADSILAQAYRDRVSDLQVSGHGVVERVLSDDVNGDRHQRFVLAMPGGQTILVAHNIDLAPRIPGIAVGDRVEFFGEYEWNPQGGVLHWTHRDPAGRHPDGWLRHDDRLYQ